MTVLDSDVEHTDVDRAAAASAAAARAAASASPATRATWLRAVADALDAAADELVRLADDETGLGPDRLTGEVARTTGQLRLFAEVCAEGSYVEAVVDHADPAAAPPRPDLRRMLRPVGPVAVYAASNFPFAFSVAGGDTASALAVGCPVVVKAHPGHPRTSRRTAELVADALRGAGAPEGLFALVEGFDAGVTLVEHPAIRAAAFTGSLAGGRALADRAAARPDPIPFFGELGSVNPVVVTAGADAARGAELAAGLAGSFRLGAGQFCTKPGVVLVPEGSRLEAALGGAAEGSWPRLLTDRIADGFRAGAARLAATEGVEVVVGRVPGGGTGTGTGSDAVAGVKAAAGVDALVLATSADVVLRDPDALLGEVFGPVTLLVRYADERDLLDVLDVLPGSLTATLHAEPGGPGEGGEDVAALVGRLEELAGRVLFAGWPTGVAVTWAQHHGGPWPATTSQHTSVGATAVRRFLRPVAYQDAPASLLPPALRDDNPLGIVRRVDGALVVPGAS